MRSILDPVLVKIYEHPVATSYHRFSWNRDGSILAAFSKSSEAILVIDVISSKTTQLQCGANIADVRWAPSDEYLFVALE